MASHDKTLKAYRFLMDRSASVTSFTVRDLMRATGWAESTVQTYISKQYRDFLEKSTGGYVVRPEFKRLSERRFLELTTQKRQIFGRYTRVRYRHIVTYEFLLPLTREDQLRKALDALFYEDTIRQRLSEIGVAQLKNWIKLESGESEEDYLRRVLSFISDKFFGYSISHVSGRFRAAPLQTRELAARMLTANERYTLDETTASVRFIIPIDATRVTDESGIDAIGPHEGELSPTAAKEIFLVHSLFFKLFVEAVVRMIQGEDEIWLLEEAGYNRSLYVWERSENRV